MSGVSIVRMYKAIRKIDPEGKYRWYVTPDHCGEVTIEALGNYEEASYQVTGVIYGHSSDYKKYFKQIFDKMNNITKALKGENL